MNVKYGTHRPKKLCFKHNMNIWQGQGSQWFLINFARAFGAYSLNSNYFILFVNWICTAFVTFQRYCSCITANVKIKVISNIPHWKSGQQYFSRASNFFTLLARRASVNFDLSANTDDYLISSGCGLQRSPLGAYIWYQKYSCASLIWTSRVTFAIEAVDIRLRVTFKRRAN